MKTAKHGTTIEIAAESDTPASGLKIVKSVRLVGKRRHHIRTWDAPLEVRLLPNATTTTASRDIGAISIGSTEYTFSDVVPICHRVRCTETLSPSSPDTAGCTGFCDMGLLLVERKGRVTPRGSNRNNNIQLSCPFHACLPLYKYACLTDSGPVHCARRFSVALATSLTRGRMGGD